MGLNRPPGAHRERPGHPGGFRACFGSVFGSPGPPQKSLGAPGGAQKAPPGVCAPLPGARGEKMPGTARAPKKRKSLRRDSGANWLRFGLPRGSAFGAFLASFSHLRPKSETLTKHRILPCFVGFGGSRRRPRRLPKAGPEKGAQKSGARARATLSPKRPFLAPLKTRGSPRGAQKGPPGVARTPRAARGDAHRRESKKSPKKIPCHIRPLLAPLQRHAQKLCIYLEILLVLLYLSIDSSMVAPISD